MTAFIRAVMHMKCGHKPGGREWVLMSTQAVREIGELVRKTHHVHPNTEGNNRSNVVINRISRRNKQKQLQSCKKQRN
jgi:hypothetical protein